MSEEGVATDDSEVTLPAAAPVCTYALNDSAEISRFVVLDALGNQERENRIIGLVLQPPFKYWPPLVNFKRKLL